MKSRKSAGDHAAFEERIRQIACRAPPEAPLSEREARLPTFKQGALSFGAERMPVVIKNLSRVGARIEFIQDANLPDEVQLSEASTGLKVSARVIWQTWGIAGLEFIDPA